MRLRPCPDLDPAQLDFGQVSDGYADLIFTLSSARRVEDRVLDVVRIARAVCALESVDGAHLRFPGWDEPGAPDALVIAELMRDRGWI